MASYSGHRTLVSQTSKSVCFILKRTYCQTYVRSLSATPLKNWYWAPWQALLTILIILALLRIVHTIFFLHDVFRVFVELKLPNLKPRYFLQLYLSYFFWFLTRLLFDAPKHVRNGVKKCVTNNVVLKNTVEDRK